MNCSLAIVKDGTPSAEISGLVEAFLGEQILEVLALGKRHWQSGYLHDDVNQRMPPQFPDFRAA